MEKPQELIETEKRIEENQATTTMIREATQTIANLAADLNKATETINHQTALLKFAEEDTQVLLAFIKSNGLKPPGRFAQA